MTHEKNSFDVTLETGTELHIMEHLIRNEFKFRAWSQKQAERFIAHIPDLLVDEANFSKWSDSGTDVIVTLEVTANLEQLSTIMDGMKDVAIIRKTICPAPEFRFSL